MKRTERAIDAAIGRRVGARRRVLGLTQRELATAVGCSFQQVSRWESGEAKILACRVPAIAAALGLTIAELYGE